jgi:hypothetical protein
MPRFDKHATAYACELYSRVGPVESRAGRKSPRNLDAKLGLSSGGGSPAIYPNWTASCFLPARSRTIYRGPKSRRLIKENIRALGHRMSNDQLESSAATEISVCSDPISNVQAFVAQVVEKFREAHSLNEIVDCYRSAYSDLQRQWRPKIGYGREMPGEQEIRHAFRTTYQEKIRERRRNYQREYMRRWRAANPEKAKAQNRKAACVYREEIELRKAVDDYYAQLDSLTPTTPSS